MPQPIVVSVLGTSHTYLLCPRIQTAIIQQLGCLREYFGGVASRNSIPLPLNLKACNVLHFLFVYVLLRGTPVMTMGSYASMIEYSCAVAAETPSIAPMSCRNSASGS